MARLMDTVVKELQARRPIDWAKYEAQSPEHTAELRELMPTLEAMVTLGPLPPSWPTGEFSDQSESLGTLGDFRLLRELGRGGMGIVYEAEQVSLGRRVALKVLPMAGMMDPRQLQRFKNEARTAATLSHPHIVSVFAVGCERGLHYFAMQYVEGRSLAEIVAELQRQVAAATKPEAARPTPGDDRATVAPLSTLGAVHGELGQTYFRRVAALAIQAARALDHAHQRGVVHRDVKPSNLLLDEQGKLWVADFGLATTAREADLTMTGDLVGTLRYMSPEQIRGERGVVDHRTDIYSLGVTLYELLTLRPAFTTRERTELLDQVVNLEPPRLRKLRASVPTDLETIVHVALHKNAASRYQTGEALAQDLERFLANKPIHARPATPLETVIQWARRRPAWATLVMVCVLACLAFIALQAWHGRSLRRALAQTEDLRGSGLRRESVLQARLYSGEIADAAHLIGIQDLDQARELLQRYQDAPEHIADVRGPELEYLQRIVSRPRPLWQQQPDDSAVLAVAPSPDGQQIACLNAAGRLRIWDSADGQLLHELSAHEGEGRALVFSPDGSRLYTSGQDRRIAVYDTKSWQVVANQSETHVRSVYALALGKNGSLLVSGARDEGGIAIWNALDLSRRVKIESPLGTYGIAFSPGEREVLTVHKSGTLCRWDTATGKLLEKKSFESDAGLFACATAPEIGLVFAAGADVFNYGFPTGSQRWKLPVPTTAKALSWSPQASSLLVGGTNGIVTTWQWGEGSAGLTKSGWRQAHEREVAGIAWMPDGKRFVTACRDGSVALWNADAVPSDLARKLSTGYAPATSTTFSPDAKWVVATHGIGLAATKVDLTNGEVRRVPLEPEPTGKIEFACGGKRLVGAFDDSHVGIWDFEKGNLLFSMDLREAALSDLAVSRNGLTAAIAVSSADGTGAIWLLDLERGDGKNDSIACPRVPFQVQFVGGEQQALLVSYHDDFSEKLTISGNRISREELGRVDHVSASAVSPSGQTFAYGDHRVNQVFLYDLDKRRIISLIRMNSLIAAQELAWSPNGRLLAIGTADGTIELCHVHTRRLLYTLFACPGHAAKINELRFSADGQTILASYETPDDDGNSFAVFFPLGNRAAQAAD